MTSPIQLAEILTGGLAQGAVYCVMAVGLSLLYGAARILNFAHGSLYTFGGYLTWVLASGVLGLPLWAAIVLAAPTLFASGYAIERIVIRPLRQNANWKIGAIMVTLGLAFILDNAFQVIFGPSAKTLPPLVEGAVMIGDLQISHYRILMFTIAIGTVVALEVFLNATRHGQAIRAVSQDMQGAAQVGIDTNHVFGMAFGLSVLMTGLAGVLLAPVFLISPLGGWAPFLKAFVIVVLGGLGSTRGACVAAFLLGIVEAFVIFYLGAPWTMPVWLVILLIVLMVRPRGLFGVWEN